MVKGVFSWNLEDERRTQRPETREEEIETRLNSESDSNSNLILVSGNFEVRSQLEILYFVRAASPVKPIANPWLNKLLESWKAS
ncbi:hypothetical protein AVEN_27272-1 [Araneus ventricosus]|uniref:Uncharacterized protein n=1 Tax=Araneus ventricosus TaxID=182803 RepID=A0A4Y2UD75_ARAVE|nr:hypothetical protein AVEN_250115-1 [Araneus ventricosus]GBO09978.1 hypothetical protein AVEN_27272-1 [Araneus ventricosus]